MSIYIVGEICGQWGGDIHRAERMILQCKMHGASAVKLQLFDTYKLPGENRELWEYLMVSKDNFLHLKQYAEMLNIDFFASVFDYERFQWTQEANIKINKIASSMLLWNIELCREIAATGKLTYCSLGRWGHKEYPFLNDNVKYFHCAFKYPQDTKDAIDELPSQFDDKLVGYSDHSCGLEAAKEAVCRGATIIEKHFTTDHSLQCKTESAHVCSMDWRQLEELRNFCDKIK